MLIGRCHDHVIILGEPILKPRCACNIIQLEKSYSRKKKHRDVWGWLAGYGICGLFIAPVSKSPNCGIPFSNWAILTKFWTGLIRKWYPQPMRTHAQLHPQVLGPWVLAGRGSGFFLFFCQLVIFVKFPILKKVGRSRVDVERLNQLSQRVIFG